MRAGKEKGLAELQTTNYKVRVFDWFSTWFSWFDRQLEEFRYPNPRGNPEMPHFQASIVNQDQVGFMHLKIVSARSLDEQENC